MFAGKFPKEARSSKPQQHQDANYLEKKGKKKRENPWLFVCLFFVRLFGWLVGWLTGWSRHVVHSETSHVCEVMQPAVTALFFTCGTTPRITPGVVATARHLDGDKEMPLIEMPVRCPTEKTVSAVKADGTNNAAHQRGLTLDMCQRQLHEEVRRALPLGKHMHPVRRTHSKWQDATVS